MSCSSSASGSTSHVERGEYDLAEPIAREALAAANNIDARNVFFLTPNDRRAARLTALSNLGVVLLNLGKITEGGKLLDESLAGTREIWSLDKRPLGMALSNAALQRMIAGRFGEAEALLKSSIETIEDSRGMEAGALFFPLNNLGHLLMRQERYAEAEPVLKRALSHAKGSEKALALSNLARLYGESGQWKNAEAATRQLAEAMQQYRGPGHPDTALPLRLLAVAQWQQGRNDEALANLDAARKIIEAAAGSDERYLIETWGDAAFLYADLGRVEDARALLERAQALVERSRDAEDSYTTEILSALARLDFNQGRWSDAYVRLKELTRLARDAAFEQYREQDSGLVIQYKSQVDRYRSGFEALTKAISRIPDELRQADEAFTAAQLARSPLAEQALAQMSARQLAASPALADAVRSRQDLANEWRAIDRRLLELRGAAAGDRNRTLKRGLRKKLAEIAKKAAAVDRQLGQDFPRIAELARPEPLTLAQAQALLKDDEALIVFLDTPAWGSAEEETFIWIVTAGDTQWLRAPVGPVSLINMVATLRCGLDEEEWAVAQKAQLCGARLGLSEMPSGSGPLPFDLGIAHRLYQALFSGMEHLIQGKRLLIVPSGALTTLPFHVLVTEPPAVSRPQEFSGYRGVPWLARKHAIAVLPGVSSLRALRQLAQQGVRPPQDYIGYGDPELKGDAVTCRAAKVAEGCPGDAGTAVQSAEAAVDPATNAPVNSLVNSLGRATVRGGGTRRTAGISQLFAKGSLGIAERLQGLCPLPDTAYEIRCVAAGFRGSHSLIRLGSAARESDIKALNRDGRLAQYRVIHFATHGLLAGDVETMTRQQAEPALVMTPPERSVDNDEGLLTQSEIAELKLNADWVVLSACNTAASDRFGAEALSGLARSFFYAGARALMVSHWPVYSDAAVRLTTTAFRVLEREPKVGRAAALQRAMLDLMDDASQADNAHPAVWAPFVVVGEAGS